LETYRRLTGQTEKKKLQDFTQTFEYRYKDVLEQWTGTLTPFKTANIIVTEKFETFLLYPQTLTELGRHALKTKTMKGRKISNLDE